MMDFACPAWLGTAFDAPCKGRVHSVFEKVVNLAMETAEGQRLLTLIAPDLPRVPDSIRVPRETLSWMRQGRPAFLEHGWIQVGEWACAIERDDTWSGRIAVHSGQPQTEVFLRLVEGLPSGLSHVPDKMRHLALHALCTPEATRWIGLGAGLTPAYDDMCVGVMALHCAMDRPAPFAISGAEDTTDVSLRYLLLAREGRFGEALGRVTDALFGQVDLSAGVEALCQVGATSGCDMLHGMQHALLAKIG